MSRLLAATGRLLTLARCTLVASGAFAMPALGAYIADFNGDGKDDVLLRTAGAWHVHELDGLEVAAGETEATDLPRDENWRVAGVGDLNGDGNHDVLFRHLDGRWFYHAMNGRHSIAGASGPPGLPEGLEWRFAGIGDLNGDGNDDVLLRHVHGRWLYFPAGGRHRIAARRGLALPRDLDLRFAGIGDLNGDGNDDVLLRHGDGRWFYHAIQAGRLVSAWSGEADIGTDADHSFAGIGDLNGDGNDDVLLRGSGGQWFYYAMNGRDVEDEWSGRADISSGHSWQLAGIGDLNGDGRDDVLLRNNDGSWFYYAMNGRMSVAAVSGAPGLPETGAAHACGNLGASASYVGHVAGFTGSADDLEVVMTRQGTLQVAQPDGAGCFAFHDVAPGRHAIKVNAAGHRTTPARIVTFPVADVYDGEPHEVQTLPTDPFVYHWEEDLATPAGAEYSSHIVEPPVVEFQGTTLDVADTGAAERLRQDYNILLTGAGWSQEHAFRLLRTMESIPQPIQDLRVDFTVPASAWRLTDDFIDGDVAVDAAADGTREVTVSAAAFVNAAPRVATVDGRRGVWFSRRLHHAGVRFVTDNGRDKTAFERIFDERYGLTTHIDDYYALTEPTGNESGHNFQPFEAAEILLLINMMEEMPAGMRKLDGMRYLLRRLNGLAHPLYPNAPAVAWPAWKYVEFMERAFKGQSEDYIHRLIVHEKAHFLWTHLFDDRLKADWIELGGWYEDPSAASGWSTRKSAEFVSAYSHLKNPNEDMAETISFFIVNPDRLKARSMAKYEFVRDRIMQGDIYLARIREDLTFEVYNLFPDYVYPGKIRSVDITVEGGSHEDKTLTVELELHALDSEAEGATEAFTRIESPIGTFFDMYFSPIDEQGDRLERGEQSTRLRGERRLGKYLKAGYWLPTQFRIEDAAGNERYQRVSDFGWRMYVDNSLEDYTPPEYVPQSMTLSRSTWEEDASVQVIHANWSVEEDSGIAAGGCYLAINDARPNTYSLEAYGDPDAVGDACTVDFLMPDYMPSSTYSATRLIIRDVALNEGSVKFTGDSADEAPATIELVTTNPDTQPPEIDINRIRVSAEPTIPDAPNGETEVTVSFPHRDDISGLSIAELLLRDPQGGTHHRWIQPKGWDALYPDGDPARWQEMERVVILPPGSIPGTWGIAEIVAQDRARNVERYNFVEIVHFEVEGE